MVVTASASLSEADVKARLQALATPDGVRLKTVMFDVDYTGDDAVYVVFSVSKQLGLGPARIRSLGELRERVFSMVDELNLGRLAYVRFLDVK
jgi:hypothetical protein